MPFHLKTERIAHRLLRDEGARLQNFALPYVQRPTRVVLVAHRPDQADALTARELAEFEDDKARFAIRSLPKLP